MNELPYDDQFVVNLVEAQPQPVFWMGPVRDDSGNIVDFAYRYCNEEMYRFTGLSREQLIGNTLFNSPAINEETRQRFFVQFMDVYTTGKGIQETFFNSRLNRYYGFLRSKVNDGVLTVLQDRDEEYKMINELARQKALLDNVMRFSTSGISVTQVIRDGKGQVVDGKTLIANEAAVKFVGLPKKIYLEKTAREIDPSILKSDMYEKVLQTLQTGIPYHTQYFVESTGRWLDLSISKMDDDHLVNVFTDITEKKKAELDLQHKSVQLNTIFNTAKAGLFTLIPIRDESQKIVDFRFGMVNQSVASYIGETAEKLTGSIASQYFPAYEQNGLFDIYRDTFEMDKVHHFDFHYEDGYDVFFNIHTIKTGDEVQVTFTDQTTLKRLQRQLEATIQELQRSNSNLEDFAYAASHDLKEPVRKIHFFADRLREELGESMDENKTGLFERMQMAAARMGLLIDDLLMYSQVSTRPKVFEEVDLNQVISSVLIDLELEIEQKNARIHTDTLPTVNGHQRQLQQLFQNLLGNALKYTREGVQPEIRVSCSQLLGKDSGHVLLPEHHFKSFYEIAVQDNGIGFEQKDAERIFNVFQRLHGNTEYKGTGVGLAIARKVVENHHGHLIATSSPGQGARFSILLPV